MSSGGTEGHTQDEKKDAWSSFRTNTRTYHRNETHAFNTANPFKDVNYSSSRYNARPMSEMERSMNNLVLQAVHRFDTSGPFEASFRICQTPDDL